VCSHGCAGPALQSSRDADCNDEEFESMRISSYRCGYCLLLRSAQGGGIGRGISESTDQRRVRKRFPLCAPRYICMNEFAVPTRGNATDFGPGRSGDHRRKATKFLIGGLHGSPEAFSARVQPAPYRIGRRRGNTRRTINSRRALPNLASSRNDLIE